MNIHLWFAVFLKSYLMKVSVPHLRVILDSLCDQFGSNDPLPWLARLKLEVAAGKALEAAKIVCRFKDIPIISHIFN